jgi:hypothetical protein|tara:strand:+ start:1892 stop:2143 length:252 start_codon:yes stop_codon:yes gene_type:complete
MHTEIEARELRCCGAADCGIKIQKDPDNGETGRERKRYCIASECMAWRWETGNRGTNVGGGYCGLIPQRYDVLVQALNRLPCY